MINMGQLPQQVYPIDFLNSSLVMIIQVNSLSLVENNLHPGIYSAKLRDCFFSVSLWDRKRKLKNDPPYVENVWLPIWLPAFAKQKSGILIFGNAERLRSVYPHWWRYAGMSLKSARPGCEPIKQKQRGQPMESIPDDDIIRYYSSKDDAKLGRLHTNLTSRNFYN